MAKQMAKIKAYHAGDVEKIEHFLACRQYMASSYSTNNWLGEGLYFWENNPIKAEKWLIQKNKGAIMECDIDTENLLNLLEDNDDSESFFEQAKALSQKHGTILLNNRSSQNFQLDCKIFNEYKKGCLNQFSGIRMAFYLGESITKDGNIYTGQHIQICLWDVSAIKNPSKYIPCRGLLS